jgi:hypothetical protein
MYRLVIPAFVLLIGSAASSATLSSSQSHQDAKDALALAKAVDGLTPGKPIECIDQYRVRDTSRFGNKILYQYSRNEKYLTDTGGGCFGLRQGDAIITQSTANMMCSGDIVRTADLTTRTPSGSCTFGAFTPYTR